MIVRFLSSLLLLALVTSGAGANPSVHDLAMTRLGLSRVSIQSLRVDSPALRVAVELEGRRVMLSLAPSRLRAPGFRVQVAANGSLHDVPVPPDHSVRGTVDELPGSVVGGTIRDGQLRAAIALADGRIFHVQPLSEIDRLADRSLHAVYAAEDAIGGGAACATTGVGEETPPLSHSQTGDGSAAAIRVAEIAFDADYEFYTLNGSSVNGTVDDIENVLAQVNVVYERDVALSHAITGIIVRSDPADPYSSTDPNTLFDQFSQHWNAAQTGVVRDVAHLMTGKNLDGGTVGISAVGVICSRRSAYGLSQSRFSTNMSRRAALTAHELGHNWNARHCDGVSPCNIMCSSINNCDGIGLPNFEPMAISAISTFASTRTCLQTPQATVDPPEPSALDQFASPAPNPSSGETALSFHLLRSARVELEIYDVAGHRVRRLVNEDRAAGWNSIPWNGLDESGNAAQAGVYYARLHAAGVTLTRRMVVLR